jgi:Tol biopolymer transport system component
LGPYEIVALIGSGGMGEVYRARDARLRRDVAIKVLPPAFSRDSDRLRRFEQEAWAAGMLNHPNLITVYDFGSHEGSPYVVSELLEGESLRQRIDAGPMPPRKAIEIGTQISRGLAAAHQKGIVHRDLKPENVFITPGGHVKILDFGLAKLMPLPVAAAVPGDGGVAQTLPGLVVGTAGYMSPEQARGQSADHRADIFAFGIILYEMVSGKPAFAGESSIELMNAILKEEPPDLASGGRRVPPALERVVSHCLEKDPEDRFQSARDLGFALEALTSASESGLPATVWPPRRARARRYQLALAAVCGLLIGAVLTFWLARPTPAEPPTFRYLTYSGHDYSPAASPNGRFIAFTSDRDGRPRIWLKQLSGGEERPLTEGPDDYARFSPLGALILFTRSGNGRSSLYRVGVLGGDARKVVDDAVEGDWSPDGNRIAFLRWKTNGGNLISAIGVAGADGSNPREIAVHDQKLSHIRWSPDGNLIAATELAQSGALHPIFLVDSANGEKRSIMTPRAGFAISSLAWSGAEELIYFQNESALVGGLGTNAGTANIIRQNVRTGKAEKISWSPDSSSLVDVVGPGSLVYDTCSPRASLRESVLGSGGGRWLTRGNANDRQPAYSPDGEWVVFSSNRSGNLDLWELSTRTEVVRRLTEDQAEDWDPVFTGAGRRIVWSSNRTGHFEIWIADADGSGARQLSRDGVDAENPTPTPDGSWIVYASTNPEKEGLWKIRPDGSAATRIVAGNYAYPEVSPDGRYVVYAADYLTERVALRVAGTETGARVPFEIRIGAPEGKAGLALGRARWMPGGRAIAFIGQDEKGVNGVYVQDFAPGKDTAATRRALAGFDPERTTESFGISPDGTRLTIASWEQLFSLMLAERVPEVRPPAVPGRGN